MYSAALDFHLFMVDNFVCLKVFSKGFITTFKPADIRQSFSMYDTKKA